MLTLIILSGTPNLNLNSTSKENRNYVNYVLEDGAWIHPLEGLHIGTYPAVDIFKVTRKGAARGDAK